ncbi:MAG: hypothetical protein QXU74_00245 [Candidatus Aenigmatarchaeota archaeon]
MGLGLKSFEDTFNFVKKNPKVFLLALIPNLVVPLIGLAGRPSLTLEWLIAVVIYFVVIIILSILVAGSYPFVVYQSLKGKEIGLKEALDSSLRRFGDIILTFILFGVIALATISIPLLLLIPAILFESLTLIIISATLLIPFGILLTYVLLRLPLAIPILTIESKRPVESLKESWRRTKGYLWSIAGATFLLTLVITVILIPVNILSEVCKYLNLSYVSTIIDVISSTISATFSGLLMPIFYFNLKRETSLK